jgi:hypothetical protein
LSAKGFFSSYATNEIGDRAHSAKWGALESLTGSAMADDNPFLADARSKGNLFAKAFAGNAHIRIPIGER